MQTETELQEEKVFQKEEGYRNGKCNYGKINFAEILWKSELKGVILGVHKCKKSVTYI